MMDAFVRVDMTGRILEFNKVYQTLVGYGDEELGGMTYQELTPERWHGFETGIVEEQVLRQGYSDVYRKEYRRKDGTIVPVELRTFLIRNGSAAPSGMWAIVRDITGRLRAEQAIEERLRFEDLISTLSARFVNLLPDQVDGAIHDGVRAIAQFFDIDRATVGLFSEGGDRLERAFEWRRPEAQPAGESMSKEQMPWYLDQLHQGNPVVLNRLEDLPPEAEKERRFCAATGMRSVLSVPIVSKGMTLGSFAFVATRAERVWPPELVQRLRILGDVFSGAIARKRMEEELVERYRDIQQLTHRLEKENIYLREEVKVLSSHGEMVGESNAIKRVFAEAERVAPTDSTVLILGETGTGKDLLARLIHSLSKRKDRALVSVSCASLPPTLIESELFGREKGAYTGALTQMVGRFEIAHGSTLFLDEIGELPLDLQSKLLRVLEEKVFERLGSTKTIRTDVRLIAATNRDLAGEVGAGRFRSDLYYRLNVFPIRISPLRDRLEDIPALVWTFVKEFEKRFGKRIERISERSMASLRTYPWPGNVRELKNAVEHAMIVNEDRILAVAPPASLPTEEAVSLTLEEVERRHILRALENTGGRLAGRNGAAELLGMKRTTLQAKIRSLGITRPST
jgi:formate hydrogenlyase transcriptional activator